MSSFNSRAKPLLAGGAAIIALGLCHGAFGGAPVSTNTIEPVAFAGVPTQADILKVCNLPKVANPISPFGLLVSTQAPVNVQSQAASADGKYVVNITVTQKNPTRFKYEDVSPVPGFPAGTPFPADLSTLSTFPVIPGDQFYGTRGTEAVSITDGQNTNIYCGDGVIRDQNLGPMGNNATSITFWWVAGPCGLANTSTVCSAYSSPPANVVVRATLDVPDAPLNNCGCTQTLQLCNTKLLGVANALNNVVLCNFSGHNGPAGFGAEAVLFGHSPLCMTIGNRTYC